MRRSQSEEVGGWRAEQLKLRKANELCVAKRNEVTKRSCGSGKVCFSAARSR